MQPHFDIIDFENLAPSGLCYAWGFDQNGTTYYALCELVDDIIGTPIFYVAMPYRFTDFDNLDKLMKGFFETTITLKETA